MNYHDKFCQAVKLNETEAAVYLVIIYHLISIPQWWYYTAIN